ncbi:energy-coupling factor ABC transporter permease [Haloferax volcanii]|uniref:Cobalamin biosynthesis protein CbiM n=3 Tax=Haloferax volcanii TaxID=2246 RepID=A0A384LED2_HALVD|nr:energy-coupling factor ABC transporter permease [Haloferax volcanii]ADE03971.1 ABC-type transport system permease protein (probable substrate nickel) [Haloferax volcanii DS2]ELY32850.1 Cobalamin biosynthesis protein CbiM [Haloferax volcanii DS2]MBS8120129.1 energy-coupling factor ABC transporter permease [Haloferax volcanii]MBS8125167.1 energy-coupling factor ABC transporter permease [Haloferax volcanii]MBS8129036.1 energy-coupling factor ABC transporter permease [Haloferax volcanii]
MHIPDGFLDPWVAGLFWLGSGIVIGIAVRRARGELGDERTPLLGVVAAGIFAAQMLNWPIPGGTSAHFVGGAFAGILLGPYLGVLAMSAVVTIQALVFGDGGIIALGANLFAMAVVDVLVGYALFRALRGVHETGAAFVAGWGAITVSALIVGVGIGLSSAFAYELSVTVLIMVVGHALLGFVEGAITAAVYGYVADARPDLVLGRLDDDSLSPEVGL